MKFIALIILVLQLAASGGTFPVETINAGFQTYIPILIMTLIVTFAITAICDFIRNKKKIKDNN